ncbi:DUF427-domain-containing protein [Saccharata proteae CBS 121410]|uniref:DUF427-domain-containing protein n=1 Tax=Saccharata proteae CBS 121410 TaxID=1314787 RepID=A0A6A5YAD0_9PEZI|nr:DUF427-domain-containing protein [Saccharata proteae CBS 121410]
MAADLPSLARHLLANGPVRTLKTSKRIRVLFNGTYIADTNRALYVWEHPNYPQYYIPLASLPTSYHKIDRINNDAASILSLKIGDSKLDRILAFSEELEKGKGLQELEGMARIEFQAVDGWFEEDTPVFVHPKDPFKRVDILHSTRPVKVLIDGTVVAEVGSSMHLYETGLPCRYYIPQTAVKQELLRPSELRTRCPYKGEAEYYHVVIGDKTYRNLVWYYRTPTHESAAVAGLLCFYNEKVDIELDGEVLDRPRTQFA